MDSCEFVVILLFIVLIFFYFLGKSFNISYNQVQEAQRVPKKLDPRKHTPRHIVITLPKIKDEERILKAAREKETVIYKGVPIRLYQLISQKKPCRQEGAGKKYSK